MTTNRLAKSEAPQRMSPQDWAERGNAYLRGETPGVKGEYIPRRRDDVRWTVRDGRCVIERA